MKIRPKYLILAVLTAVIIGLDQLTKRIVIGHFRLSESKAVVSGLFSFTYVRNTGAAFGLLHDANPAFRIPFFILVPLVALTAIAFVFRRLPRDDWKLSSALSLVIGGAIGNLIDRVQLGFVVDFLDFHWNYRYHFPAFNVADSAICIGVAVLISDLVFQDAVPGPGAKLSDEALKKGSGSEAESAKEVKVNASAPH